MFIKIRLTLKSTQQQKLSYMFLSKPEQYFTLRTSNCNSVNKLPYAPQPELTQVNNCVAVISLLH